MFRYSRHFVLLLVLCLPLSLIRVSVYAFQENISIAIQSPLPGQAVQGTVSIVVETNVEGFKSAELYFAYANNPTDTWFLIGQSAVPISGTWMDWDTTLITDGNYDLKLIVYLNDGSSQEVLVSRIRVRNYSPVETNTPVPVPPSSTPQPGDTPFVNVTATPTSTVTLTPTFLPTNPSELASQDIFRSLGVGSGVVMVAFLCLGSYILVRNWLRNRQVS